MRSENDPVFAEVLDVPYESLKEFWARITEIVLRFERAHADGTLEAVLTADAGTRTILGDDLWSTYERLAAHGRGEAADQRIHYVSSLLSLVESEFFHVSSRVPAIAVFQIPESDDDPSQDGDAGIDDSGIDEMPAPRQIRMIQAQLPGHDSEIVRVDQLLSARYWGIEYTFDDPEVMTILSRLIVRRATSRLAVNLRQLELLLRHADQAEHPALWIARPMERSFERLILDILNEEQVCARAAPLSEDLREKTDIRVRVTGLDRRRGARVQVTQLTNPIAHDHKIRQIRRADEIVFLSPRTLAEFLFAEDSPLSLAQTKAAVRQCLSLGSSSVDEAAITLKRLLIHAIRHPHRHASGPLGGVPEPVRALIREFVRFEALRSTQALRARLGRRGPRADARDNAGVEEEIQTRAEALRSLQPGLVVEGIVRRALDYGVFIDLDGIDGMLHVSQIALPPGMKPKHLFIRGQTVRVVILSIDSTLQRVSLGLPDD